MSADIAAALVGLWLNFCRDGRDPIDGYLRCIVLGPRGWPTHACKNARKRPAIDIVEDVAGAVFRLPGLDERLGVSINGIEYAEFAERDAGRKSKVASVVNVRHIENETAAEEIGILCKGQDLVTQG